MQIARDSLSDCPLRRISVPTQYDRKLASARPRRSDGGALLAFGKRLLRSVMQTSLGGGERNRTRSRNRRSEDDRLRGQYPTRDARVVAAPRLTVHPLLRPTPKEPDLLGTATQDVTDLPSRALAQATHERKSTPGTISSLRRRVRRPNSWKSPQSLTPLVRRFLLVLNPACQHRIGELGTGRLVLPNRDSPRESEQWSAACRRPALAEISPGVFQCVTPLKLPVGSCRNGVCSVLSIPSPPGVVVLSTRTTPRRSRPCAETMGGTSQRVRPGGNRSRKDAPRTQSGTIGAPGQSWPAEVLSAILPEFVRTRHHWEAGMAIGYVVAYPRMAAGQVTSGQMRTITLAWDGQSVDSQIVLGDPARIVVEITRDSDQSESGSAPDVCW